MSSETNCPNCQGKVPRGAKFCESCLLFLPADWNAEIPNKAFLATRGQRLLGFLIDQLFVAACGALGLLVDYLRQGLDELPTLAILAVVAGVVVNLVLLAAKGQTLGKMVVKTKVANYEGHKPSWVNLIFVRTMPFLCLSKLPLFAVVDVYLVFQEQRQCLHDKAACTVVLKAG